MKKFSLIILALGLSAASFAQGNAKFGLKGGMNITNTSNDNGGGTDARIGYHVGGLAHIHLNPEWALQPEVVFSSQGGKYYNSVDRRDHNLVLNYVNIPLQLQYMFNNGFRLQTGPQLGVLTSAKDKRDGEETGYVRQRDFKDIDFSWSFGLGYLTYSGLGIDARYNLGLSNINNTGNGNTIHNQVGQIGLFYLFNNNHKVQSNYRHRRR